MCNESFCNFMGLNSFVVDCLIENVVGVIIKEEMWVGVCVLDCVLCVEVFWVL